MTDEEIKAKSTKRELWAVGMYERIQRQALFAGGMTETDLLELSHVVPIIVARNERLGLVKKAKKR